MQRRQQQGTETISWHCQSTSWHIEGNELWAFWIFYHLCVGNETWREHNLWIAKAEPRLLKGTHFTALLECINLQARASGSRSGEPYKKRSSNSSVSKWTSTPRSVTSFAATIDDGCVVYKAGIRRPQCWKVVASAWTASGLVISGSSASPLKDVTGVRNLIISCCIWKCCHMVLSQLPQPHLQFYHWVLMVSSWQSFHMSVKGGQRVSEFSLWLVNC